MKINPIANPNILRSYQATKPVSERTSIINKRDEVTFSQEALEFSKVLEDARDMLEVRTTEEKAHIAEITTAVRNGEYDVDSDKVAEKILESVLRR